MNAHGKWQELNFQLLEQSVRVFQWWNITDSNNSLNVNNRSLEFIDKNGSRASQKHFLRNCFKRLLMNFRKAVRLKAIKFLRSDFPKFRLWSSTRCSECSRMHDLQTRFTRTSYKGLSIKLAKCPFLFYATQDWEHLAKKKLFMHKMLQSFFGIHASLAPVKDGCAKIKTTITRSKIRTLAHNHQTCLFKVSI